MPNAVDRVPNVLHEKKKKGKCQSFVFRIYLHFLKKSKKQGRRKRENSLSFVTFGIDFSTLFYNSLLRVEFEITRFDSEKKLDLEIRHSTHKNGPFVSNKSYWTIFFFITPITYEIFPFCER